MPKDLGDITRKVEDEPSLIQNPKYSTWLDYITSDSYDSDQWVVQLLEHLSALDKIDGNWAKYNGNEILLNEEKLASVWSTLGMISKSHVTNRQSYGTYTGMDEKHPALTTSKEEFKDYFKFLVAFEVIVKAKKGNYPDELDEQVGKFAPGYWKIILGFVRDSRYSPFTVPERDEFGAPDSDSDDDVMPELAADSDDGDMPALEGEGEEDVMPDLEDENGGEK